MIFCVLASVKNADDIICIVRIKSHKIHVEKYIVMCGNY